MGVPKGTFVYIFKSVRTLAYFFHIKYSTIFFYLSREEEVQGPHPNTTLLNKQNFLPRKKQSVYFKAMCVVCVQEEGLFGGKQYYEAHKVLVHFYY